MKPFILLWISLLTEENLHAEFHDLNFVFFWGCLLDLSLKQVSLKF